METLGGEKAFVGWGGMRPEFTEYAAPGEIAWDARFVPEGVESYRAYTMPWSGQPVGSARRGAARAAAADLLERGDGRDVSGGSRPTAGVTETIGRDGFETQVRFPERPARVQVAG